MKKINIEVDIGYAFDFLSIYEVKSVKLPNKKNLDNYVSCLFCLASQLGEDTITEIIVSKEYKDLFNTNKELFELVDLAKTDKVKASEVDAGVYKRFLAKRALQEKFFPDAEKIEQKFGYEQK